MRDEIKNMLEKAERKFPDEETTAQDTEDAQRVLSACKKYLLKLK